MEYSLAKSAWKAAKAVAIIAACAALTALLSPEFAASIANQPGAAVLIPAIQAAAVAVIDWLKHRHAEKPIVR